MEELIAPTINFILVVALLTYFTRKPLKKLVGDRQVFIRSQVEEAAAQKREAEFKFNEFSAKLEAFEAEARELMERAKVEGEALKARIIAEAKTTAERIVREAEMTAQANSEEQRSKLTRDTIAKAIELAEQMVKQRLTSEDHRRLVGDYVKGVQDS